MPKMTGIELLQIVKKKYPRMSVIIMTGEPTVETAMSSVKSSAQDYLIKPVGKHDLLKTVRYEIERKKLSDENYEYKNNLEELVKERTKLIGEIINSTIASISAILEIRDQYTAGHALKVGNLAVKIGLKMKIEKKELDCLYVSGYLHDIGKIAIPAEILSKPSKLDYLEYEMMKRHVDVGYEILKKVKLPWPVADVVRQHHERMDGSGYPLGVSGEELRIESKILAVADVVEAMTSNRPYRPGLGLEAALNEIKKNKGKLYDSKVVSATIELLIDDKYEFEDTSKDMELELEF
jgi:putative nucleotidyltransferase with HDIG domain